MHKKKIKRIEKYKKNDEHSEREGEKKLATNRKLGRTTDIRMAMLKNLTTDLLVYGKVETTLPKAKEVKAIADSLISLAIKKKTTLKK